MLSERELANRWGISPKTLQRWRMEKRGPAYIKFSKCVRYSIENVQAYEHEQMTNPQASKLVFVEQASIATGIASSNRPQSKYFNDAGLIGADDASSMTKLPAYYFSNKEMRNALGIPHYYVGRMVRFKLSEIQQWEISKATRAFGISIDQDVAPIQKGQEPIPAQKYTLREAMHLLATGKLKQMT